MLEQATQAQPRHEHIGSAHYDVQLEALKVVARQRLTPRSGGA
jgi:hypothetical protein